MKIEVEPEIWCAKVAVQDEVQRECGYVYQGTHPRPS